MSSSTRSWLGCLLPFLVSGGMALGSLVGLTSVSDALVHEGPAGDMAGAAGALMASICIVVGFGMATLTLIVSSALRRRTPDHMALRLALSVAGGGVIGALPWNSGALVTTMGWILLLGVPVVLSWSWRAKAVSGVDAPVKQPLP